MINVSLVEKIAFPDKETLVKKLVQKNKVIRRFKMSRRLDIYQSIRGKIKTTFLLEKWLHYTTNARWKKMINITGLVNDHATRLSGR